MKNKLKLLLALMLFGIGVQAQVGVAAADTSLRATVNGVQRTWKNFEYYKTAFGLYYNKVQSDAKFELLVNKVTTLTGANNTTFPTSLTVANATTAITQNIIRFTPIYSPTAGGTSLTISEFANTIPLAIIRGNQEYKVSGTATETTVSVNTATGVVTTYYPFGAGETIYGKYQGVTPGPILTDGFGFSVVQNYNDIFLNTHYGGTQQWDYFVTTDFQNNQGQKSKYQYTPGVGLGWIAVYFVN